MEELMDLIEVLKAIDELKSKKDFYKEIVECASDKEVAVNIVTAGYCDNDADIDNFLEKLEEIFDAENIGSSLKEYVNTIKGLGETVKISDVSDKRLALIGMSELFQIMSVFLASAPFCLKSEKSNDEFIKVVEFIQDVLQALIKLFYGIK